MNKVIIAITGPNGSGKDTVGQYLLSKISPFVLFSSKVSFIFSKSFSRQVNSLYKQLLQIDFYKLTRKQKELERPNYINFAQGMKNLLGKDIWAKLLIKELNKSNSYIITDLRFQEEYDTLFEYCKNNQIQLIVLEILSDKNKEHDELKSDFTINNKEKNYKSMQDQIDNFIKHFNLI